MNNIIYVLPSEKGPAGGIKVSLKHSEIINKLNKKFSSQVIFIKKKKSSKWKNSLHKLITLKQPNKGWKFDQISIDKNNKSKWFDNNVIIKENFKFNKKKDFVILPEIFAHLAEDLLIKNNINYAIFVQNGHAIEFTSDHKTLNLAYSKAKFILSVSNHVNRCIKLAFPNNKNKIFIINQSIAPHELNYKQKSKIITYMPRKLPDHSKLVLFFLKRYLPKKWSIVSLEKMNEKTIFKNLKKSKIFLSFSNLEGFGLPPLEAASLGNIIIGYTGEAGKEYWKSPIFKKINQGDILSFVNAIKSTIQKKFDYLAINEQRKKLLKKYSENVQKLQLCRILNNIQKIVNK